MTALKVRLENCYGIKKLKYDFEFSDIDRTYAVYSPNGVMKTSFAKTVRDYIQNKKDSKDQIFDRGIYDRSLVNVNDTDFDRDQLFVIGSFVDTEYSSDKISTLLVRSELREKYEKAIQGLVSLKKPIISTLAGKDMSNSSDCESEIVRTFSDKGANFFDIIHSALDEIETEGSREPFEKYQFKYNDIFDNKSVSSFIAKNKENIKTYYDTYYDILTKSDGFFAKDGSFGTLQASNISKSVSDDSFFKAGHSFILNKQEDPITSAKSFQGIIEDAKNKVLSDPEVKRQFDKIDGALAPSTLNGLRNIIRQDREILLELIDINNFQRKYWLSHLNQLEDDLKALNRKYGEDKKIVDKIIEEANDESDRWKDTIRIFSSRFVDLPFRVDLKNKKDAVLGLEQPELVFIFVDRETKEEKEVERSFLTNDVLSNGEKRAFYLLNVIFEIQSRLHEGQKTLFIIDDIADSFDYKNKYAIVEYLHDISIEADNFCSIILTHNFDFYRTITLRLKVQGGKRLFAQRESGRIELVEEANVCPMDPFKLWKESLCEPQIIALVPFVRNLIEYGSYDSQVFLQLTSLLHKKKETKYKSSSGRPYRSTNIGDYNESNGDFTIKKTEDILLADIEDVFKDRLGIDGFPENIDRTKSFSATVMDVADSIGNQSALENKIILSMAIRYVAEDYMIEKINNDNWLMGIAGSQTSELIKKFKGKIQSGDIPTSDVGGQVVDLLEAVNITTPENIHINSFMYEPLVDMGIGELKSLYEDVKRVLR